MSVTANPYRRQAGGRDACAARSISPSHLLCHRHLHEPRSRPPIARARQNIRKANAVFPCWSCKMAEQFSSTMPMAGRLAESGQSSVEQKASGGSRRWLPRARDCSNSTILFPDTITEWKSDPRKSQITIRQLLNQTDGIEGASRLQRASTRDRNAMAIRLSVVAEPWIGFYLWPEPSANLFRAACAEN